MKLYLLRHAESEYNRIGLLQGRIDCNLSDDGLKQTYEKAKVFDATKYDICFCSPLKRTLQTAQILAPNLKIICDDRIIERSLGDLDQLITSEFPDILNTALLILATLAVDDAAREDISNRPHFMQTLIQLISKILQSRIIYML